MAASEDAKVPERVLRKRRSVEDETVIEDQSGSGAPKGANAASGPPEHPRLGEVLVRQSALDAEELAAALADQAASGRRIGQYLLDEGLISDTALARALAEQLGLELADLGQTSPSAAAIAMLPEDVARSAQAVPLQTEEGGVQVVMADPTVEAVNAVKALALALNQLRTASFSWTTFFFSLVGPAMPPPFHGALPVNLNLALRQALFMDAIDQAAPGLMSILATMCAPFLGTGAVTSAQLVAFNNQFAAFFATLAVLFFFWMVIGWPAAVMQGLRCLKCHISPIFDGDKCILCGGCADVCPENCLRLVDITAMRGDAKLQSALLARYGHLPQAGEQAGIIKDETRCIRCGLCAVRCPTGAITMEKVEWVPA